MLSVDMNPLRKIAKLGELRGGPQTGAKGTAETSYYKRWEGCRVQGGAPGVTPPSNLLWSVISFFVGCHPDHSGGTRCCFRAGSACSVKSKERAIEARPQLKKSLMFTPTPTLDI